MFNKKNILACCIALCLSASNKVLLSNTIIRLTWKTKESNLKAFQEYYECDKETNNNGEYAYIKISQEEFQGSGGIMQEYQGKELEKILNNIFKNKEKNKSKFVGYRIKFKMRKAKYNISLNKATLIPINTERTYGGYTKLEWGIGITIFLVIASILVYVSSKFFFKKKGKEPKAKNRKKKNEE